MTALALSFNSVNFDVVDRNNQPWLRSPQIGDALGYKKGRVSIDKIYKANADEFTDSMTALVELETNGGKQQVRIFSLRGCHLLAMFARTAAAKSFRKWVLDILDERIKQQNQQALPEPPSITKEQAGILYNIVEEIAGPDGKVRAGVWKRFHYKFKVNSYHDTPADKFEDAKAYLELKLQEYNDGVRWHWLDDNEIQALVDERVKAMQGEVLPKEEKYTIPFELHPRWFMSFNSDNQTITCKPVSPDCIVIEPERIAAVISDPSGSIKRKDLPAIISAVAQRMTD